MVGTTNMDVTNIDTTSRKIPNGAIIMWGGGR